MIAFRKVVAQSINSAACSTAISGLSYTVSFNIGHLEVISHLSNCGTNIQLTCLDSPTTDIGVHCNREMTLSRDFLVTIWLHMHT